MAINSRIPLYQEMERLRGRPLLVYVTSERNGSQGAIAGDVVSEILSQLQILPNGTKKLDLLLVSNGGDPTVAWRIVSLIRERVEEFSVIVPQAAFSAATLIALGADEIVMHPNGNLGPTDVQIQGRKRGGTPTDTVSFGFEDLSAFLKFVKDQVGLTDQSQIQATFAKFCDEVGTVAVGVAARSSRLGVLMGEKLLQLHMKDDGNKQKARAISEKLTRDFFHHGYPLSRTEAKDIGLKVADRNNQVEDLIWRIWKQISEELLLREPFVPLHALVKDPTAAPLFALTPGAPVAASTAYENIHAIVESSRLASRFITAGVVAGIKVPPNPVQVQVAPHTQKWIDVWPPSSPTNVTTPGTGTKKVQATKKRASKKRASKKVSKASVAKR